MRGDVPGDQLDAAGRAVDGALLGVLLLQVSLLRIRQAGGDLVEPTAHCVVVDGKLGHALFVEQRRYRLIVDSTLHRVGMHDGAELAGGLFVFQQWRASKGDVARVRQSAAHALVHLAALAAVPFIHQHDQVRRNIPALGQLARGVELVYQREEDALGPGADAARQLAAGGDLAAFALLAGSHRRAEGAAADEVAGQLVFQIDAVGNDDHAAFLQALAQQERLGEEHHREALARAGGVPHHAPLSATVGPDQPQPLDQRPDAEELLVARDDLADLAIEQHEAAQQFEQARRREQTRQQPVLIGRQHRL